MDNIGFENEGWGKVDSYDSNEDSDDEVTPLPLAASKPEKVGGPFAKAFSAESLQEYEKPHLWNFDGEQRIKIRDSNYDKLIPLGAAPSTTVTN